MTGEAPRASASPWTPQPRIEIDETTQPDAPDANRKAMVEGLGLMASKGWLAERKLIAIHDFFMARGLYPDFNNFIKAMK